jgi:spore maturation protein CgeB
LDTRLKKWGDYHFGRCLTKYLKRLGHEVETDYDPKWDSNRHSDVVLVLRGKHPHKRTRANKDAFHVMWNISHPESVELEEYASYDMVFVASESWASQLRERIRIPVYPLLQCTDTEEFFERPMKTEEGRRGFVFVGNSRGVQRDGVVWALEHGLDLKVWGRQWGPFIDERHVVADYVDNEELGTLYSRSRVTLNDHWDDMKKFGFINNRIFDAIACGLPVISDYHQALHDLFPTEILYFRDRTEFKECLERTQSAYPEVLKQVAVAQKRVVEEFSFAGRAKVLSNLVLGALAVSTTQR